MDNTIYNVQNIWLKNYIVKKMSSVLKTRWIIIILDFKLSLCFFWGSA